MAGMRDNLRVGMDLRKYVQPAAPKRLGLDWYIANTTTTNETVTVPSDATFLIARGIGCGGRINGVTAGAGGGGAFALSYLPVTPGESLVLVYSGDGAASEIRRMKPDNSYYTLLKAAPGNPSTDSISGVGGTVAASVGSFRRAGTAGASLVGGNSGFYTDEIGQLNLYGTGANANNGSLKHAWGYGGGGAVSSFGTRPNTGGVLVLEYFTADPRRITW